MGSIITDNSSPSTLDKCLVLDYKTHDLPLFFIALTSIGPGDHPPIRR
jgi:hypothetical protein